MINLITRQSVHLGILIMLLTLFLVHDLLESWQTSDYWMVILDALLIASAQWDFWRKWKPALDRQQKLDQ